MGVMFRDDIQWGRGVWWGSGGVATTNNTIYRFVHTIQSREYISKLVYICLCVRSVDVQNMLYRRVFLFQRSERSLRTSLQKRYYSLYKHAVAKKLDMLKKQNMKADC